MVYIIQLSSSYELDIQNYHPQKSYFPRARPSKNNSSPGDSSGCHIIRGQSLFYYTEQIPPKHTKNTNTLNEKE